GLAARGLLERGVGRGTFVRPAGKVVHDLSRMLGFTAQLERQGLLAEARVLHAAEEQPPPEAARALKLGRGERALRVRRVRLTAGTPLALEDSCLPARCFPGLLARDLSGSLYRTMGEGYGLAPVSAVERL